MLRDGPSASGCLYGCFSCFLNAFSLQCRYLDELASHLSGEFFDIDLVLVLSHDVHHVDGGDHRNTEFGELSGEVQVPLKVRAVNYIQDGVRLLLYEVIPSYYFFQCIGRKGIDSGKVGDDDIIVLLEFSFFLLHRDSRPVSYELVGSGERVEQRGLSAVRVARQGYSDTHFLSSLPSPPSKISGRD